MTAARKALDWIDAALIEGKASDLSRLANVTTALRSPLAAVVRAAMEWRQRRTEFGWTDAERKASQSDLDAALDAFNAAALAQGFQP